MKCNNKLCGDCTFCNTYAAIERLFNIKECQKRKVFIRINKNMQNFPPMVRDYWNQEMEKLK